MLRSQVVCAARAPRKPAVALVRTGGKRDFNASAARSQQHLIILGSGWGGYELLRGIDKKRWHVTVVSPNNYFNFTPLLASCCVGTLEFRSAIEPNAYQAWCDHIDFKNKTLTCMPATPPLAFHTPSPSSTSTPPTPSAPPAPSPSAENAPHKAANERLGARNPGTAPFTLRYDRLVVAVGAYNNTFSVPGVKENAYFLKDVRDARAIRARILECFEQAHQPTITDDDRRRLLHFCIVGGGPTGVEFAAELHDLLHTEVQRHFPGLHRFARISLYDVAPTILGSFDQGLQSFATQKFQREGIRLLTTHHVERVEPGKMYVKEQGEVYFGLLVWSTGLAPNPLVESITEIERDPKTKRYNHGQPDPNVWALGDAAMIKEMPLPATAKAKYLWKKLNALAKDRPAADPFRFHNAGSLAYIGDWQAVYDRTRTEKAKGKEAGRFAWLLWRSAYFTMTLSWKNK
ncbi:pyridine nucleotide-disulfide oxidoreductase-domain-containing protein [Fomitopsis serialis]|uniref:pyridine nucleotide-disulfide oxidoreductase-domain-containing protein n=1 Tax=Fomitopsis serialis TaxID=139415 RepID=UPI00200730A8|nr:pyridine nucleotide-disulfide oxidoreductase-domain-containing protein [Neoantrodia serialis]KAH9923063.1 pyridine nucleotide-disulfide oxidoreductase-domain-containing protein [Neoantrodia serialis]